MLTKFRENWKILEFQKTYKSIGFYMFLLKWVASGMLKKGNSKPRECASCVGSVMIYLGIYTKPTQELQNEAGQFAPVLVPQGGFKLFIHIELDLGFRV